MKESFDDIVKKLMDECRFAPEKASWDNFKEKLDSFSEVEGSNFDELIKNKLEIASFAPHEASWNNFKKKLDADQSNTDSDQFDELVKSKIKTYQNQYKESHWKILQAKLQTQAKNLENLYISKGFEFIAITLLLMIFIPRYFDFESDFQNRPEIAESNRNNVDNYKEIQNLDFAELIEPRKTLYSINEDSDQSSYHKFSNLGLFSAANQSFAVNNQQSTSETDNDLSTTFSNTFAENFEVQHNTLHTNFNQKNRLDQTNFKIYTRGNRISSDDLGKALVVNDLSSLPKEINLLKSPNREQLEIDYKLQEFAASDSENGIEKFVSIQASYDNNLIDTPPDIVYRNIDEVLFDSPGLSVGASMDFKLNKIMQISAGLGFSRVSYSPQLIEEKFIDATRGGTFNIFLDRIEFDMVQIPLQMRLNYLNTENWSFFTQIGITPQIVANSNYETIVEAIVPPNRPGILPSNNISEIFSQSTNQPRLLEKDFIEGVLQGGELADNLNVTADIGVGLSRRINQNLSLYSSLNLKTPVLNRSLGPNRDMIGSLNFTIGTQYRI